MNNPHIWNEINVIYKVISVDSSGLETSLPVRLQHPLKLCVRPYRDQKSRLSGHGSGKEDIGPEHASCHQGMVIKYHVCTTDHLFTTYHIRHKCRCQEVTNGYSQANPGLI